MDNKIMVRWIGITRKTDIFYQGIKNKEFNLKTTFHSFYVVVTKDWRRRRFSTKKEGVDVAN